MVRVPEGVVGGRQIVPGGVKLVGELHVTGGQDDVGAGVAIAPTPPGGGGGVETEARGVLGISGRVGGDAFDALYAFESIDGKLKLLYDQAQVGEVLFGGDVLLFGSVDGDAGNGYPLRGAEKLRPGLPGGNEAGDLPGLEVQVVDVLRLTGGGNLNAYRAGADDDCIVIAIRGQSISSPQGCGARRYRPQLP